MNKIIIILCIIMSVFSGTAQVTDTIYGRIYSFFTEFNNPNISSMDLQQKCPLYRVQICKRDVYTLITNYIMEKTPPNE